jgi:5-hydroxyisourate hydrolase
MSAITTHVLDVSRGRPAGGVAVRLDLVGAGELGEGRTDSDGRLRTLMGARPLEAGVYRLTFAVGEYFRESGIETFYPTVEITFEVRDPGQHYHVPLLVSPFGYSTYRGS